MKRAGVTIVVLLVVGFHSASLAAESYPKPVISGLTVFTEDPETTPSNLQRHLRYWLDHRTATSGSRHAPRVPMKVSRGKPF
ncbi:MAG: hypothetical protein AB1646_10925 [Thermodesulfobacteriota bacterium]